MVALNSKAENRASDIAGAIARAEANESSADSAPKQQVVNGWAAKDLLEIEAHQLNDIAAAQEKTMLLLALIGLTIAFGMIAVVIRPSGADVAKGVQAGPSAEIAPQ